MEYKTIKERVIYLIHQLNLSVAKFERVVGWSVGYVSTIKETFKLMKAQQITRVFPNVNINYIMKGEGELFVTKQQPQTSPSSEENYRIRFKTLVKQLRLKGLVHNQTDLSNKLGYNPQYFSRIANNSDSVSKDFIAKLLKLDPTVDIEWLIGDTRNNNQQKSQQQQNVIDAVNALPDNNAEADKSDTEAPVAKDSSNEKTNATANNNKTASNTKVQNTNNNQNTKKESATQSAKPSTVSTPNVKPVAPAPAKPVAPINKTTTISNETILNNSHVDELLIQNRLLIDQIRKQGDSLNVLIDILKSKI